MFEIRKMTIEDWEEVKKIWQEGIDTNMATFRREVPSYDEFDKGHAKDCRLVIANKEKVVGWAALSPTSSRDTYKGVAELSVYIDPMCKGKGLGKSLLRQLLKEAQTAGYWTLQAVILEENKASISLHQTCGFRLVGKRERIGQDHLGNWRSTLLFEKRRGSQALNNVNTVRSFWERMDRQEWSELGAYFSKEAVIHWCDTNEAFIKEEFVRANCEYPGNWEISVVNLVEKDNLVISVARVKLKNKEIYFYVNSYFYFDEKGKITLLKEYWSECGEVPQWRQEKKIGKPIST